MITEHGLLTTMDDDGPGALVRDTHGVALPSRYEIRLITPDLANKILALIYFNNFFESSVWSGIYEGQLVKKALETYHASKAFYQMPELVPNNGLSYCIWDKEFVFKKPESAAVGGACYWDDFDLNDPDLEVNGKQKLLDALDFPIVSFGLSIDKFAPGDMREWEALMKVLPLNKGLKDYYAAHDPRPKGSWEPTATGQVIDRVGTGTREAYQGQGIMKALAKFIMLEMKARGYRAIQISCGDARVHHVWTNPPPPFRSSTLVSLPMWFYEIEEDGKKIRPYEKSKVANFYHVGVLQRIGRLYMINLQ
ncbi:uncharacterized protein F4822DRAFT_412921 [Hypoxylon trugodes]|uniref:uncharacterized protein n=1 Tax=Hypoxylon trugodes TaxID=326681 RepID=UPI00218E40D0|nr:uncharacterized protein F4822DRAFT_412921 [Hypoxylon trugodes]KAI1385387.1 hypothetical protein F4822DRAFT_412921 [Hypoxylon trugodes]